LASCTPFLAVRRELAETATEALALESAAAIASIYLPICWSCRWRIREKKTRSHVRLLEALGYTVTLAPAA
jgi:hypothetical protein